jgi:Na+/melibiose symporter-like transporter
MQLYIPRGDSTVAQILVNCALTVLALLVAFFAFRRWQKSKRIWYIISAIAAILAALAFWLSREEGSFLFVGAVLLFALGELFKKK